MAILAKVGADPDLGVIAFDANDTSFRIFVPEKSDSGRGQFAIVRNVYEIIPNYFGTSRLSAPRYFDTQLCGRAVKLYGITEDEAFKAFQRAFRIEDEDLIVPVVKNIELSVVIDKYILSELDWIFRCCPRLPSGYVRPQKPLTEDDRDMIVLEKTVQAIESLEKQCSSLMNPVLKPEQLLDVLQEVPEELLGSFITVINLLEQRVNIFKTIVASRKQIDGVSSYTGLDTLRFVLGEEMLKRFTSVLPIIWKLPSDQVKRVHQFVECKVEGLTERRPIGSERAQSQRRSALAEQIRKPFSQFVFVRDYYLKPEFLSILLKLVHTPLRAYPRVEKVREAFQSYITVEKLLYYSTGKLFQLLAWAKKKATNTREQIVEELEKTSSWQDVLPILQKHNFPELEFTKQEQEIFVLFFTILLSVENEMLMSTVLPLVENEVADVLAMIIDAVVLEQKEVCVDLEDDKQTPRGQLLEIEQQAKDTLDRACGNEKIRMVFRPLWGGKDAEVGSVEMKEEYFYEFDKQFLSQTEHKREPKTDDFELYEEI